MKLELNRFHPEMSTLSCSPPLLECTFDPVTFTFSLQNVIGFHKMFGILFYKKGHVALCRCVVTFRPPSFATNGKANLVFEDHSGRAHIFPLAWKFNGYTMLAEASDISVFACKQKLVVMLIDRRSSQHVGVEDCDTRMAKRSSVCHCVQRVYGWTRAFRTVL